MFTFHWHKIQKTYSMNQSALTFTEQVYCVAIVKRDITHLYSHTTSVVWSVQMATKLVEVHLGWICVSYSLLSLCGHLQHQSDHLPPLWSSLVQSNSVCTSISPFLNGRSELRTQSTCTDSIIDHVGILQFLESRFIPFCHSWCLSWCNHPSGLSYGLPHCTLSIYIDATFILAHWAPW